MEMSRISRLLRPQSLADSLLREPGHQAVRGSVVYGVLSRAVHYHDFYRGVREVTSTQDGTLMAKVVLPKCQPDAAAEDLLTNPVAVDNFLQVPGIYANCLAPCPLDEAYVPPMRFMFVPELTTSSSQQALLSRSRSNTLIFTSSLRQFLTKKAATMCSLCTLRPKN